MRHQNLLRRDDSFLVIVDLQEALLRAVHQPASLLKQVNLLLTSARILGIPVLSTTQNAERLGGISEELATSLFEAEAVIVDKMTFSCCGSELFLDSVESLGRKQAVVAGVETHICVAQTAMDLLALGYQTHVAADSVTSRSVELHKLGMERLRDSGVLPCAAESVVYEWLGEAGTPEFRAILQLVK
jgi:nicotinamidase-related amidase